MGQWEYFGSYVFFLFPICTPLSSKLIKMILFLQPNPENCPLSNCLFKHLRVDISLCLTLS